MTTFKHVLHYNRHKNPKSNRGRCFSAVQESGHSGQELSEFRQRFLGTSLKQCEFPKSLNLGGCDDVLFCIDWPLNPSEILFFFFFFTDLRVL